MTSRRRGARAPLSGSCFAVVDVETTGFSARRDRVIEVAVVEVDPEGSVAAQFSTLVDPRRDVGPTRVHGITASDLIGAPAFEEVAEAVWERLRGKVLVAHNARFDLGFLDAEFSRCGRRLPPPPVICTMQLAPSYLAPLPARTLDACCNAAGIALEAAHTALADALAAASLLAHYRRCHAALPASWAAIIAEATAADWGPIGERDARVAMSRAQRARVAPGNEAPLAVLLHRLPRGEAGGSLDPYLAVLDRVLEDRIVTDAEVEELIEVAEVFGLSRDAAEAAHRSYLHQVAALVWEDGVVTDAERRDFLAVAQLLAVSGRDALSILESGPSDSRPVFPRTTELHVGDRVAFTGETERPRQNLIDLATRAGLVVTSSVSTKTALLVAADPHSQSGKAKAARSGRVRIVTEQVFLRVVRDVRP